MNDPAHPARDRSREPAGSLDRRSRRPVADFLVRSCVLAGVGGWLYLGGTASVGDALGVTALVCALVALTSSARAPARGETPGRGSLNGWDELPAFVALSRLAHLLHGLHT